MLSTEHHAFILREISSMTLAAATQRSGLYKPGTPEKARRPFHESLRALLEELAKAYTAPVGEEMHIRNIERVTLELSTKHQDVLAASGMRIGLAQKALNLYLKYLWCLGEIHEPPHCPIDAIVLKRVPGYQDVCWTRMKTIKEYCDIIAAAKTVSKGVSLAVWELALYNTTRLVTSSECYLEKPRRKTKCCSKN
jgi:hypothetical protein